MLLVQEGSSSLRHALTSNYFPYLSGSCQYCFNYYFGITTNQHSQIYLCYVKVLFDMCQDCQLRSNDGCIFIFVHVCMISLWWILIPIPLHAYLWAIYDDCNSCMDSSVRNWLKLFMLLFPCMLDMDATLVHQVVCSTNYDSYSLVI